MNTKCKKNYPFISIFYKLIEFPFGSLFTAFKKGTQKSKFKKNIY